MAGYRLDRIVAHDLGTAVARPLGQRLGDSGRVDVAVPSIGEGAEQAVGVDERMAGLDLVGADQRELDAGEAAHGSDAAELVHPLGVVGEAQAAGQVEADVLAGLFLQPFVEADGVALQLHDVEAGAEVRHVARRVPG